MSTGPAPGAEELAELLADARATHAKTITVERSSDRPIAHAAFNRRGDASSNDDTRKVREEFVRRSFEFE
ncbi:MAG: hypothetical protein JRH17_07205 [Deltaproteobacteria bacterium]|nr:hypothetical protein [Deltaproteobacteria bacterium]